MKNKDLLLGLQPHPESYEVFIMITSVCNLPRRKRGLEAPTPEEDEMTILKNLNPEVSIDSLELAMRKP